MAKDPAMLWYWSDWNSGTTTLSRFLKGCYMDLLHAQFNSGHLTLEEIKTVLGADFSASWDVLFRKFEQDKQGKFYNIRLEFEQRRRQAYTKSRHKNLRKSNKKILKKSSSHMESDMASHMDAHMENENININNNVLKNKKESIKKEIFGDELYMESLAMTHKGKDATQAFDECFIHHANAPNPPTEISEWKQKLNTWLINTKANGSKSDKGTSTETRPKTFGGANYGAGLRKGRVKP